MRKACERDVQKFERHGSGSNEKARISAERANLAGIRERSREQTSASHRKKKPERRPTLTIPCGITTIGPEGLNDRIRNGIGCDPLGMGAPESYQRSAIELPSAI